MNKLGGKFYKTSSKFFFDNIDVKINIASLLKDFGSNIVFFLFCLDLKSNGRISARSMFYILDFFFYEHYLSKISLLRPVFKVTRLCFFVFSIFVFIYHYKLQFRGVKNVMLLLIYISRFITC